MSNTIRLNFEFPKDEYPYLKMLLAQKGISLKEFATDLLLKAIEEYEDQMLSKKAKARLKELEGEENISFEDACKLAGWNDDNKV